MEQELPALASHLRAVDFDLEATSFRWFFTAYVGSLPSRLVLRIWDAYLAEGRTVGGKGVKYAVVFAGGGGWSEGMRCRSALRRLNTSMAAAGALSLRACAAHGARRRHIAGAVVTTGICAAGADVCSLFSVVPVAHSWTIWKTCTPTLSMRCTGRTT